MPQNPAWRTYKYAGKKKKKRNVADEETTKRLIAALEKESIKYETYFKLIIATGMRRGECCGLKWKDVDFGEKSIHICRNVVKVTGEDILVKEPKTAAGKSIALSARGNWSCTRDVPSPRRTTFFAVTGPTFP